MREQIGLVIWGCKGGYRAFCSNNVVNTGDEVIAQTIKDIRSFIRIHRTGHDFFAIEFTSKYKVFTNYRSSNDSGTGAFIAFTIYVPHSLKVENMRVMFKEMMDGYFREYMNPLSNTPLTGKYDDINKFLPILERYEVKPDRPYYRQPSKQDDKPQLLIYEDLSIVDKYFDSPYRPEFFNCQEVMLLNRDIYDNPSNYEVEFVTKPILIEKISEPEAESKLVNNLVGLRLSSLTINGEDMFQANGNCPLSDSDTISFSIEKNEFCEKFVVQSQVPGRPLTVKEAVDNGWLRRRNRRDYEFVQPNKWTPKKYYLPLSNTGVETDKLCGRIILFDNYRRIELKKQERGCFFELSGEEVNSVFSLGLIPVVVSSGKPYVLIVQQGVSPKDMFQSGIYTNITEKVINKTSKSPDKFTVSINIEDFNLKLSISSNKFSLLLPASKLPLLKLSFEAEDYNASFDDENVSFVPAYKYLYVSKDILDDKIYKDLKLRFEVAGDLYDTMFDRGKGMPCFKLSYNHWLALKEGINQGHIFFDDEELDFIFYKDIDRLSLQAIVVTCTSSMPVYVTIQKDGRSDTLQMGYNNHLILSKKRQITVDENVARILDIKSNDNIDIKKIVLIEKTNISNEENRNNELTIDRPKKYITFINCQNFCIRNNSKVWPIRAEVWQTSTEADVVYLYNGDQVACIIQNGKNENYHPGKDKDNFKIVWKDNSHCDVTYFKESVWDKIKKFRKWIYSIGVLVIMVGFAFALYPVITKLFAGDYKYTIAIQSEGKIDSIDIQSKSDYIKSSTLNEGQWAVVFTVPNDKLEEVKKMLRQDPQLTILSKSDGNDTFSLRSALGDNSYDKLGAFFDSKNKEREGQTVVTIKLRSQIEYDKLVADTPNVDINKFAEAAKTYPGKSRAFSELAFDLAYKSNYMETMQRYLELSDSLKGAFKVDESYNMIVSKLEALKAQKVADQKKVAEEKQKEEELKKLNGELNLLTITKERVIDIQKKARTYGDKQLEKRCQAYIVFFSATSINSMTKDVLDKLSPRQQRICNQTYANGKKLFDDTFKKYKGFPKGMSFLKAEQRIIDKTGKGTK